MRTWVYDERGNLVQENYVKNNNKSPVVAIYIYDEMNKMVQGTNEAGEISLYIYNGLVGGEMIVDKNAYGYHGFDSIEPSVPTALKKHEVIRKDFVLDYTTELMNTLQETEYQGLNYRYEYGTDRNSAFITPIPNGGGNLVENEAIKVYYHKDYLGTTDFMTSDYTGKVVSWTMYNEWGEITHNAVLNCGVRELDLVKNYTGCEYDSVIGQYFAKQCQQVKDFRW